MYRDLRPKGIRFDQSRKWLSVPPSVLPPIITTSATIVLGGDTYRSFCAPGRSFDRIISCLQGEVIYYLVPSGRISKDARIKIKSYADLRSFLAVLPANSRRSKDAWSIHLVRNESCVIPAGMSYSILTRGDTVLLEAFVSIVGDDDMTIRRAREASFAQYHPTGKRP